MQKWDYSIISMKQKDVIGNWTIRIMGQDYKQAEGLALLGASGWELVSTELAIDKSGYYLFFKREIHEQE